METKFTRADITFLVHALTTAAEVYKQTSKTGKREQYRYAKLLAEILGRNGVTITIGPVNIPSENAPATVEQTQLTHNSETIERVKALLMKYCDPKPEYDGLTASTLAEMVLNAVMETSLQSSHS